MRRRKAGISPSGSRTLMVSQMVWNCLPLPNLIFLFRFPLHARTPMKSNACAKTETASAGCPPMWFLTSCLHAPRKNPPRFFHLSFRIVRFRIAPDSFETVVTNLNPALFPPQELARLYHLRWGIETSFSQLKYSLGLLHFHAKKAEYIH